jgi:hypothetical protein
MVTTAERFVERSAGPITRSLAGFVDITCLVSPVFDVVLAASAPVGAAGRRLGAARRKVNGAAFDQTPVVHKTALLTHAGRHRYSARAAAGVCIAGCRQWAPAQLRRTSALAIPATLDGGSRR